ncbi:MAG TPA: phosphate/phosphite/phosphonate ABC transporter substrate-binding protein [Gammaproteobacteria bacterium]|nr:phosphate/phosphite/phosphonate ABC transporter substrate-binding protein [Gammaproteobacteria bacterium]
MARTLLLTCMLLVTCLPLPGTAGNNPQAIEYRFGVFPYLSAVRLEEIYAPVSAELARESGLDIHFRTSSTFERFFTRLKQQHYDIALIQPFWYPPAVDKFGYLPLVRMEEPLSSLIMVLEDSPLQTVADLKGTVIATPPAFVPVVHMARRALLEAGLVPDRDVQLRAFKSVDSCFQQLLIGTASACIAPPFAPAVIMEKMNVRLRVLLETPSIPNLSVVVHSRLPLEQREQLKDIFLSWDRNTPGQKLLKTIKTRAFVPAVDAEYDAVRTFLRDIRKE